MEHLLWSHARCTQLVQWGLSVHGACLYVAFIQCAFSVHDVYWA